MQLNAYEQKSRKNYSLNKLVTVLVMVFTPTGIAIVEFGLKNGECSEGICRPSFRAFSNSIGSAAPSH